MERKGGADGDERRGWDGQERRRKRWRGIN
jgi:hypothetical protein